jgi:hypothetical protein
MKLSATGGGEGTLHILRGQKPLALVNSEIWDNYLQRYQASFVELLSETATR